MFPFPGFRVFLIAVDVILREHIMLKILKVFSQYQYHHNIFSISVLSTVSLEGSRLLNTNYTIVTGAKRRVVEKCRPCNLI